MLNETGAAIYWPAGAKPAMNLYNLVVIKEQVKRMAYYNFYP